MEKSSTIAELSKSLAKAQAEIQPAKMNSINPFLKNRYADLGEVIQAARIPLTKNGIAVAQHAFTTENSVGIETVLMHESGEWMSSSMELPLSQDERGRSLAQSAGSLITYLRRYTYAAIIGIYADEDTDANQKPKATVTPQGEMKRKPLQSDPTYPENIDSARQMDEQENAEPDYSQVVNRDGVLYSQIDTPTLANMANAMRKALKSDKYAADEERQVVMTKIAAAEFYLSARNGAN